MSTPPGRGSRFTRTTTSASSISAPNDPSTSPYPPPTTAHVPSFRLWSTALSGELLGDGHHFTAGSNGGRLIGSCGGGSKGGRTTGGSCGGGESGRAGMGGGDGRGCGGGIRVSSGDNVDGGTGGDAGGEGNVFVSSVGKTKPVYRLAAAQPTTTQQEPSKSIARLRCGSHRLVAVAVRGCGVLAF